MKKPNKIKAKEKEIKSKLDELEEQEGFEEQEQPEENDNTGSEDDLQDRFNQFSKQSAEFKPEEGEQIEQEKVEEGSALPAEKEAETKMVRNAKIKMFVGFCCFVLSGLNNFILNKIRSSKVPLDKMFFTEEEQETLMPYMDDPKVIEFIDKMPTVVIAVLHIEYLMFSKHAQYVDEYKVEKKRKKSDNNE